MPLPELIKQLVERFERNLSAYKSGVYNETQVRQEFINPFFEALGWDVSNKKGYAEAYKDVIHEYSQKTSDSVEAPDYCFRIGGTRKFFVEAKKPSVNLKEDIHPAFQLRRYAWSAKLPLSILTDFEEFAVYDCRIPPKKNDKASTARIIYFNFKNYLEKWDEIESIFSRDSILKGSFDKFAETNKKKRGTAEVDDTFLKVIEQWREILARNIALRNSNLSTRELNFSVQKTIDRIIFLRICEDRGVEEYGQLMALQNGTNVYKRMLQIFTRADEKYNSGLFHFELEKNRVEGPDELTPNISIDDKTLKDIVKNLYYPESPFEFSVLPSDILGQVYEQFLGKVIRLTEGHQARIEDKPEVKKAGGVYYTPTYIVEYIVQNTLGKILTPPVSSPLENGRIKEEFSSPLQNEKIEKTNVVSSSLTKESVKKTDVVSSPLAKGRFKEGFPKPKAISKLKILDPACGSGSFLIVAYQHLLDWHLKYYTKDDKTLQKNLSSKNPKIYQAANGDYKLTTAERKRILLNNIYGVDIDSQAVEVTKLSLLLKVLEGESEETLNSQLKMFHERALPDLGSNIKCGNSLIGPDFYDQMDLPIRQAGMNFLDDEEKLRINVFDWKKEFKEIMDNGGFDVVIGNPPYIKIQVLNETQPQSLNYLKQIYEAGKSGNIDIYVLFAEKGFGLINKKGIVGFILPHKFFQAEFGKGLRDLISRNNGLNQIVYFRANQIFKGVTTYTCLLFLDKVARKSFNYINIFQDNNPEEILKNQNNNENSETFEFFFTDQPNIGIKWNFINPQKKAVFDKINKLPKTLETITEKIFVGLQTSADKIYVLDILSEEKKTYKCFSQEISKQIKIEKDIVKPFLMGKDIKRYRKPRPNKVVIFPYLVNNRNSILMEKEYIKLNFPLAFEYLSLLKDKLENREKGKMKGENYYAYIYPKNLAEFERKKIMTPYFADKLQMTVDLEGNLYHTTKVYSFVFKENIREDLYYFLGVLNSKLFWFFMSNYSTVFRGGWIVFATEFLKPFPIRLINFNSNDEKNIYKEIIAKVDIILNSNTQKIKTKTPQEKTALKRQIEAADKQIDQLVYQLYGLTEEEIKIVEGE